MNFCGLYGNNNINKGYCDIDLAKKRHICTCHQGWTGSRCQTLAKKIPGVCKDDGK